MLPSHVTLKGSRISLKGDIPTVGKTAPDFTYVNAKLAEESLYDSEGEVRLLIAVPSLDTGVCSKETEIFSKEVAQRPNLKAIVISKDLPFAMNRFCLSKDISNLTLASDYRYNDFCNEYGTEILDSSFKGLTARAVFVVDKDNHIRYVELVPEIGQEPNYAAALAVADEIL